MNKVIIIGNLGSDPELRYIASGQAVCELSVATNEKWKDKQGQMQEHTEWSKVTVWGVQAENCEKYLSKGRRVAVEGKLRTEKWQDKDGKDRWTTKIIAQSVEFLGGDGGQPSNGQRREKAPAEPAFDQSFNDDDIPF